MNSNVIEISFSADEIVQKLLNTLADNQNCTLFALVVNRKTQAEWLPVYSYKPIHKGGQRWDLQSNVAPSLDFTEGLSCWSPPKYKLFVPKIFQGFEVDEKVQAFVLNSLKAHAPEFEGGMNETAVLLVQLNGMISTILKMVSADMVRTLSLR